MRTPLLVLLLSSPAPAFAASDCVALGGDLCWYAGAGAVDKGTAPLLVYFRGHWNYAGTNPPPEDAGRIAAASRLRSARQAFKSYELKRVADENKAVVIVTGSSDASVSEKDVEAVSASSKVKFGARWLASHSGGFVGLGASLKTLGPVDRVVLLDTFYFGEDFSKLVAARVAAGTVCTGFLTPHNKDRWAKRFVPHVPEKNCPVNQYVGGSEHEDAVRRCLTPYLGRTTCL